MKGVKIPHIKGEKKKGIGLRTQKVSLQHTASNNLTKNVDRASILKRLLK